MQFNRRVQLCCDHARKQMVLGIGCGGAALFQSPWAQQKTPTEVNKAVKTTTKAPTVANVYMLVVMQQIGIAQSDFNETSWNAVVKTFFPSNQLVGIDLTVHEKNHTQTM